MSSKNLLSKAVFAVGLSGVLLGFMTSTSVLAMQGPQDDAFRAPNAIIPAKITTGTTEEDDPKLALITSPFYDLDKNIVYEIMSDSIEKDKGRLPLALASKYFLELSQRGEQPYDTLLSLSKSPFKKLDDVALLKIMILSLGNKKQLPFGAVSRYFHNLSYDGELSRTLTIMSPGEPKEILSSRNPSRKKGLKESKFTIGYLLPSPPSLSIMNRLCFGRTVGLQPKLTTEDFQSLLRKFPDLTGLYLKDYSLRIENAKVLERYLVKTSFLKELDFEGEILSRNESLTLSNGFSKNTTLTSLHLSVPVFVNEIYKTICRLPLLKVLALKGLANSYCITELSQAIEQKSSPLQVLDLGEAILRDDWEIGIAEVITEVCERKNIQLKLGQKKMENVPARANHIG